MCVAYVGIALHLQSPGRAEVHGRARPARPSSSAAHRSRRRWPRWRRVQVDLALLNIESTAAGSINQVYDVLREKDLHIVGEETIKVDLCLCGAGRRAAGRRSSACCRIRWRSSSARSSSRRCPTRSAVPAVDTAEALRLVAETQGSHPGGHRLARGRRGVRADGPAAGDRQPRGDPAPLRGAGPRAGDVRPAHPLQDQPHPLHPPRAGRPAALPAGAGRTTASA